LREVLNLAQDLDSARPRPKTHRCTEFEYGPKQFVTGICNCVDVTLLHIVKMVVVLLAGDE